MTDYVLSLSLSSYPQQVTKLLRKAQRFIFFVYNYLCRVIQRDFEGAGQVVSL